MTEMQRYNALTIRVLELGERLTGKQGQALSPEEWQERFAIFQGQLAELRAIGDRLRPVTLREQRGPDGFFKRPLGDSDPF